jgi:hypothetical protein
MTPSHPDHQRCTGHRLDEDAAMDTFTVRLPRWRSMRLFGRNPLIRAGDRVEALVVVFAVGTAVYDSRSHLYAAQAQNPRTVTATVTGDKFVRQDTLGQMVTVPARWFAAGTEHTGTVSAPPGVKTGDSIDVWVAEDGSHIGPPLRTALDAAVAAAEAIWFGAAMAAAALVAGTRAILNRARHARWQEDFDKLVES